MNDTRGTIETAQHVSIGVMSTLLTDALTDGEQRAEIITDILRQGLKDVDEGDMFELIVCVVAILGNSHAHLVKAAFDENSPQERMRMTADVITSYVQHGLEEYET